jgi:glycosyltransferase involved in cell wall biosynthesis
MSGVLVDALGVGLGGGLTYVTGQVGGLAQVRPDLQPAVLAHPGNAADLVAGLPATVPVEVVPVPSVARRVVWEQTRLLSRVPAGAVLLAPGNVAPLLPGRPPVVLVVQNPNAFGPGRSAPWNRSPRRRARIALMRASARRADVVVAVSQAMADAIVGDIPSLTSRVEVVSDGEATWPDASVVPEGFVLGPDPWFVSVSQDWPHKQLDELVQAWALAFAGHRDPPQLVMVGALPEARQAQQRALIPSSLQPSLLHLGAVSDRRVLRHLVEGARALVSVSALEAHPHTPGEAGVLGTPVVLSDIPAHREVAAAAGAAAVFVGVGDHDALVEALRAPPAPRLSWRSGWTWEQHATQLGQIIDRL